MSMLKNPTFDKDKELFERIRRGLYHAKEKLDETEGMIESIKSKWQEFFQHCLNMT